MKNTITISHVPLEECSKSVDFATEEPYDGENDEHYSEWAMALALGCYAEGLEVPSDEFFERLTWAKWHQHVMEAVERGDMSMEWSTEEEDFVYGLTEQGKKRVKND